MAKLTVIIPDDLRDKLKVKVARERTTVQQVVNDLLREWVRRSV